MSTEERADRRGPRTARYWVGLVPALLAAWLAGEIFLATSHKVNQGKFVPPLDDTYIYYQYAKQIARGELYRYQDGEAVSTGSTSVLYPVLLAPAWKIGLRGSSIFWAGFYINILGLLLCAALVHASLRRLLPDDPWMASLGGLLLVGNGWFLWGIASGMDTGVLAAAIAFAFHGVVLFALDDRRRPLAVALALLGVSRPEGLALAWTTVLAIGLQQRLARRPASTPSGLLDAARAFLRGLVDPRRLPPWPFVAGALAGTVPTLILAAASGHLSTNGMVLKSHAAHHLGWVRYMDSVSRTLISIPERLLWVPSAWLRGLVVIALLVGVGGLWGAVTLRREETSEGSPRAAAPGWVAGLWCVAIFLFYGLLMGATEQHNRYFMGYWPLVVLLTMAGIHTVALPFPARAQAPLRRALATGLILIGLASVPHWAREYAFNCKDLREQHVAMSTWVDERLPQNAVLAINDAGAIAYLSNRRVVDIFGLVSNDFRAPGHWRAEGYIWESLERRRPSHLVIYPGWFDDLQRLYCLRRIHSIDLKRETLLGDREKVAYEILWNALPDPGVPRALPAAHAAWKLMDVLDVADATSEREHAHAVDQGEVLGGSMFRLRTFQVPGYRVIDGGRGFSGSEQFRARNLRPGAPLLLGVRSELDQEMLLEVSVGPQRQIWHVGRPGDRAMTEVYLLIPALAIREASPEIRIRCVDGRKGFTAYHYFLLQPPR